MKVALFLFLLFIARPVFADLKTDVGEQLQTTGRVSTYDDPQRETPKIQEIAAGAVQVFLSLLGTVFFVQMVMSGYWLITARGEEQKVEKAQMTIRRSVIGLAIVLTAYAVTLFVTATILSATGRTPRGFRPDCNWLERGLNTGNCP